MNILRNVRAKGGTDNRRHHGAFDAHTTPEKPRCNRTNGKTLLWASRFSETEVIS